MKNELQFIIIYYSISIKLWNYKVISARHEEVWVLMKKIQPSCVCLQKSCNLESDMEFYATARLNQKSRGGTAIRIRKKTHKILIIIRTIRVVVLEVYQTRKRKHMLNTSPPNRTDERGRHERSAGQATYTLDASGRLYCTQSLMGK